MPIYNVGSNHHHGEMEMEMEMKCDKFGTVQVNKGFECVKHNGKSYAGNIVKVAAYPKGTLVTIEWYYPRDPSPTYRSIYLEDCEVWWTYTYNREVLVH
jgi:hypothetical protein